MGQELGYNAGMAASNSSDLGAALAAAVGKTAGRLETLTAPTADTVGPTRAPVVACGAQVQMTSDTIGNDGGPTAGPTGGKTVAPRRARVLRGPYRAKPGHKPVGHRVCLAEQDVALLARRRSARALDTISAIMEERRNPPGVRLRAAQELLARGWGAPRLLDGAPQMSTAELHYAASKLRAVIERCKISGSKLPLWAQVASELLSQGHTTRALAVSLAENPAAAGAILDDDVEPQR